MNDFYNLKISAKGSKKIGEDFFREVNHLFTLVNCIEIDLNHRTKKNFQEETSFLWKLKEEKKVNYTVHAQYLNGNLADFNEEIRRASLGEVYYAIDTAEKLGASVVTIHPALEPYGLKFEKIKELEIDSYKKIAVFAKEKNIKIGLENLAPDLLWIPKRAYKLDMILETVREVNFSNFGITLDIGHANTSKENYTEFMANHQEKIFHIHAHDNMGSTIKNLKECKKPDPHLPLGEGNVDWEKVIGTLKKLNYQNYFELEGDVESVEKGLKFIENY